LHDLFGFKDVSFGLKKMMKTYSTDGMDDRGDIKDGRMMLDNVLKKKVLFWAMR